MGKFLGADQDERLAEQGGESPDEALQVAHVGAGVLVGAGGFLGVEGGGHGDGFALVAAPGFVEGVALDGEKPGLEAGAGLELMDGAEGADDRILDEVVRYGAVSGQETGEGAQLGEQGGDLVAKLGLGYVGPLSTWRRPVQPLQQT